MSIETLLKNLILAVEANTAALSGSAPASGSAAKKPAAKKPAAKKGPTLATLTKLAGDMMKGETDLDEDDAKAALAAFKKAHGYKISETPADEIEQAMTELKALIAGEDPYESEDGDDEDLM